MGKSYVFLVRAGKEYSFLDKKRMKNTIVLSKNLLEVSINLFSHFDTFFNIFYIYQVKAGAKEVAVFGSASEGFSQKNINCSVEESLKRFQNVFDASKNDSILIRG